MCEHEIRRRITKAEVDEKLIALLKAGDYKKAAELMFAWTVSQIDPEEFADKFIQAAREWRKNHPLEVIT